MRKTFPEVVHVQPVGETYEDSFMREVGNLNAKRQSRPSMRYENECHFADNFTADIHEPVNIDEAWTGEHSVQWKEATDSEYESLLKNHTWDLVPPPDGKNVVGSRWIFS